MNAKLDKVETKIEDAPFPQQLKFNQESKSGFQSASRLRVRTISAPNDNYKYIVHKKVKATWEDKFLAAGLVTEEKAHETFMDVLKFKTLPNSLESLVFDFVVEGLPLVEVTHLLRHRSFFGIHAQCTGDRDLRDDNFYLPDQVASNKEFNKRYKKLHEEAVKLYSDMVDSKEVSLLDARYVLPRSSTYFYYFSGNLKDLMMFIKQRRCTMVQPAMDNIFAHEIYQRIIEIIPEVKEVLSLDCDGSCHYVNAKPDKNTRLFQPDYVHKNLMNKKQVNWTTIYDKEPF